MYSNNQDRGLIFVWGDYGKKLQDLDKERLFVLSQNNPERYLFTEYNKEISSIIKLIENLPKDTKEIPDNIIKMILELNKKHTIFNETNKFFKFNPDNLSIGSILAGEKDKSSRYRDILSD